MHDHVHTVHHLLIFGRHMYTSFLVKNWNWCGYVFVNNNNKFKLKYFKIHTNILLISGHSRKWYKVLMYFWFICNCCNIKSVLNILISWVGVAHRGVLLVTERLLMLNTRYAWGVLARALRDQSRFARHNVPTSPHSSNIPTQHSIHCRCIVLPLYNILYMILKQKFKALETEVGIRN